MAIALHRWIVAGLCVLLVVFGLVIARTASSPAPTAAKRERWVRTAAGWQIDHWESDRRRETQLHPAIVAAFISLASVASLVAFARRPPSPPTMDGPEFRI